MVLTGQVSTVDGLIVMRLCVVDRQQRPVEIWIHWKLVTDKALWALSRAGVVARLLRSKPLRWLTGVQ